MKFLMYDVMLDLFSLEEQVLKMYANLVRIVGTECKI